MKPRSSKRTFQFSVMSFNEALARTIASFCRNTSLHGLKHLIAKRTLLEKCFWFCVQLVAIFVVLRLLLFSWDQFMDEPTVTVLEDPHYPISLVPFPGVSVCDLNKISRKKVRAFAEELSEKSNYSVEYVMDTVKLLGKLYDYGGSTLSDDLLFVSQSFMDAFAHVTNENRFSPYDTLKRLAPSCDEILSNCTWNDSVRNCTELFSFEITVDGFCCLFNYGKISLPDEENQNRVLYSSEKGGLSVVVRQNVDDYFYPLLSSLGTIVDIFNPNDFPDVTSGSLHQRLVPTQVDIYFRLSATVLYAMPEVKKYSVNKRKCVFPDESKTTFSVMYSRSDCLLDCRIRSMMALCQCVPLNYATMFSESLLPQCNLLDIPCLYKYQHKWRRLFPEDYQDDDMETDKQDSLQCKHCIPSCQNVWYKVISDYTDITDIGNLSETFSMIDIRFHDGHAQLYKHDVIYYWYEIVSNLGGICGLIVGLSLISFVELLYFFTVDLAKNWLKP